MSTHTGRLLLGTQDPFLLPDRLRLTTDLTKAGLLGLPLPETPGAFAVGRHFLQLVTFAGCAVRVELSPHSGTPFCHIRFPGPFERPVFQCGRNTRPPRCRSCRSQVQDWRKAISAWHGGGAAHIACPACGEVSPLWRYDWKEKAGFGRLFIQVEEIFPGEAAPTPVLMKLLAGSAGCGWRHFYIQDD